MAALTGKSGIKSGDGDRLRTFGIPVLTTTSDIARAIGIREDELCRLADPAIDHYTRFRIAKRRGGHRIISFPHPPLRNAQRWLLEAVLGVLAVEDAAVGFRVGRSIVDNATPHAGRGVVVNFDLKDFFPSIGFRRVKMLFLSLGYGETVATTLALLSTECPSTPEAPPSARALNDINERRLPQGGCTSPAISNLIARNLDLRLTSIATSLGFRYTRYADDLTFSHESEHASVRELIAHARRAVEEEEFTLNPQKTRVMRRHRRQVVTGLVVNEMPRVSRTDIRRFRSVLHHCEVNETERVTDGTLNYARGYLAYVRMVSPIQAEQICRRYPWLLSPQMR
jgi:RNA-directed DNA polymerase